MPIDLTQSLIQTSPTAAVAIVAIWILYKLSKDFSNVIVKYSREHSETQLKTVTKMQELTHAIDKLREEVVEQSGMLKRMYEELWQKQRKIKSLERKKALAREVKING